jgi:hypothetical protein
MTCIPHTGSAYPLNGAEWIHLAYSREVATGSVLFLNPFSGLNVIRPKGNLGLAYPILPANCAAKERDCPIDIPRNLAKSVIVECILEN